MNDGETIRCGTVTATRRVQFCAGHRVAGHENKCRHLHGHNYVVLFEARAVPDAEDDVDAIGRVIDFAVLKERLGGWIDANWDHGFIVSATDQATLSVLQFFGNVEDFVQKVFELPYNPTAENLARYLGSEVAPLALAGTGVEVVRVTVWETENCLATWEAPVLAGDVLSGEVIPGEFIDTTEAE